MRHNHLHHMHHHHLPVANQCDVLRSYSKDKFYRLKQTHFVMMFVEHVFSQPFVVKCRCELELISDALYYSLTTGLNKQTIGQENFHLVLYNVSSARPLTAKRRVLLVALKLVVPYLIAHRGRLKLCAGILAYMLTLASKLNRVLFLFGHTFFYSLEHWLTSTGITTLDMTSSQRRSVETLRLIGLLKAAILLLHLFSESHYLTRFYHNVVATTKDSQLTLGVRNEELESARRLGAKSVTCLLCLDEVREATSAACGHIFCFACIQCYVNNARNNASATNCPSCRMAISENKLIYLHNF